MENNNDTKKRNEFLANDILESFGYLPLNREQVYDMLLEMARIKDEEAKFVKDMQFYDNDFTITFMGLYNVEVHYDNVGKQTYIHFTRLKDNNKSDMFADADALARSMMKQGDVFTRADVYHFVEEAMKYQREKDIRKSADWVDHNINYSDDNKMSEMKKQILKKSIVKVLTGE